MIGEQDIAFAIVLPLQAFIAEGLEGLFDLGKVEGVLQPNGTLEFTEDYQGKVPEHILGIVVTFKYNLPLKVVISLE